MQPLIECVPNFSEGRNPVIISALADAVSAVPGVALLNRHSDPDHHRTVLTFAGAPQTVYTAALQAMRVACKHIDLNHHHGQHPRLGATDVCPFVPLQAVDFADCVALAHQLGQQAAAELDLPIYYYGLAATRPERVRLADIRRGGYELWQATIASDPARTPDAGPAQPHPYGATTVGVRKFLVAFNIYLNTNNVKLAEKIARRVRASSGGLPGVQARGFAVAGQAQVSLNLTDLHRIPLLPVYSAVKSAAAELGTAITHSELVGLMPQHALLGTTAQALQLHNFDPKQHILEAQLHQHFSSFEGHLDGR